MTDSETFPAVPVTAEELAAKWARSDALYTGQHLGPEAIACVRDQRMKEAGRLPNVGERARMFAKAKTWDAPKSQDYGSMRDWLDG